MVLSEFSLYSIMNLYFSAQHNLQPKTFKQQIFFTVLFIFQILVQHFSTFRLIHSHMMSYDITVMSCDSTVMSYDGTFLRYCKSFLR